MHLRTDRSLIRTGTMSRRHVVLDLVAPAAPARKERAPVNVALVLDRSGSMGCGKLELAKEAAISALRLLRPTDRFSVVVYDHEIDVVVESTPASAEAVSNALRQLAPITARGTTDLFGGWLRGCEQIAAHLADESIGRCLFLTDGHANVGTTEPGEIAAHVRGLRERGVSTSTFGIGHGFNADLLLAMADEGGGNSYFVESAAQIPDYLTSELGETLEITARDVRVEIETGGLAGFEVLSGFRTEQRGSRVVVHLADLVSNQEVQVVMALQFPGATASSGKELSATRGQRVGVEFEALAADATFSPPVARPEWTYAGDRENDAQPRDRDVDRIVGQTYAQRGRMEALSLNERGDYDGAQRVLHSVAERISRYAGDDAELRRLVDALSAHERELGQQMAAPDRMALYSASARSLRSRDESGRSRRRGQQTT